MIRTFFLAGIRLTAIHSSLLLFLLPQALHAANDEIPVADGLITESGENANAINTEDEAPDAEESLLEKAQRSFSDLMNHEMTQNAIDAGSQAMESTKNSVKRFVGKKTSRQNRQDTDYSLFYMPMNYGIIMPTKTGFAGSWMINGEWSLEAEYLKGGYNLGFLGIDLFDLSERIIGLNARWYAANSFNLKMGLGERKYNFSLGSDYLNKITGGDVSEEMSLSVKNQVLLLGLGNRWQFDRGFTIGFDWFELIIPVGNSSVKENFLHSVKDQGERDDIQDVIDYMRTGTTFNALKLHVGYAF